MFDWPCPKCNSTAKIAQSNDDDDNEKQKDDHKYLSAANEISTFYLLFDLVVESVSKECHQKYLGDEAHFSLKIQ